MSRAKMCRRIAGGEKNASTSCLERSAIAKPAFLGKNQGVSSLQRKTGIFAVGVFPPFVLRILLHRDQSLAVT